MKTCSKCKVEKEFIEFYKNKSRKDGVTVNCKNCFKQYRLDNKEKINELCRQRELNNKEKIKDYRKKYNLKNKDKLKEYKRKYYQNNKDYLKTKQNKELKSKQQKERRNNNALHKLTYNIRNLIRISIKGNGYTKKSKTYEILGCAFKDFKLHLESQFTEGMTWENHGKWHMDHIYPVSRAIDEEHLIRLNHYTNFQPLWAIDNIKKGNKI